MNGIIKISLVAISLIFMSGSQSCKKSVIPQIENPSASEHNAEGATDDIAASKMPCEKDDDCITINADCCGCGQGGKQRAIPKKEASEEMLEMGVVCSDTQCPQVMSTDPSCKKKPHCNAATKRCELR